MEANPTKDEDDFVYDLKYSRLLAVLEHDGLRALQTSKILIIGAKCLGAEIGTLLALIIIINYSYFELLVIVVILFYYNMPLVNLKIFYWFGSY